ncbi:glycosyltransferase family 2 protein [Planctomicrobium piriforme]|uniref:Glycosyl transferase family 2 n=1 Tax=Planctomicrobium piriforme TaxID=1576369 RepID=A0A1I3PF44_9PLAN|nr:glycosyltransferase family 2 protein [Planctomicrobium piriforme]SFJ20041.1 Glycosyl transferase family 2 [Planctomicrobium piriforme]
MTGAAPLVSVIVPTFNRERHLRQCLRSALDQTYPHLEVIVVDDGSTDGTPYLMAELQAEDSRLKYVYQSNAGVSAARNTALRHAQGDMIAFLDSDDAWLPWKLELQVAALQAQPEVGMIWTDMSAIDEAGEQLHERFLRRMYGAYSSLKKPLFEQQATIETGSRQVQVRYGNIAGPMFHGNLVHTSTVLLRASRAREAGFFKEAMRRGGEDYAFHLKTCRLGSVAFIDLPSVLYRIGANDQLTHRRNQLPFAQAFMETLNEEARRTDLPLPLPRQELDKIYAEAYSWLGGELVEADRRLEAAGHLLQSLRRQPKNWFAWRQLVRCAVSDSLYLSLRKTKSAVKRLLGKRPAQPAMETA